MSRKKTFLIEALCFVVPFFAITIYLVICLLQPSPSFLGTGNYFNMLLNDPIFVQVLLSSFFFHFLITLTAVVTGILLALLLLKIKRRKIAFVICGILLAISIFMIILLYSGYAFGYFCGITVKLGIISDPSQSFLSPEIFTMFYVVFSFLCVLGSAVTLFFAEKPVNKRSAVLGKSWFPVSVFFVFVLSFFIYNLEQQYFGFPDAAYSAKTVMMHLSDYYVFSVISICKLLIWADISIVITAVFYYGRKAVKRFFFR